MTKQEARQYFLKQREKLSPDAVKNLSEKIYLQWKTFPLENYNSYHLFLPIKSKNEVNTFPIINYLWQNNKEVYCSKVSGDQLLHFKLTPFTQLKENSWGIPEPVEETPENIDIIDCVLIPLLAYDINGNRVGYGKGYYDRFLSSYPSSTKIGVSFFEPLSQIQDMNLGDIPLDFVITPYYCSGFPMPEK